MSPWCLSDHHYVFVTGPCDSYVGGEPCDLASEGAPHGGPSHSGDPSAVCGTVYSVMERNGRRLPMDSLPDGELCDASLCRFSVGSQPFLQGLLAHHDQVVWRDHYADAYHLRSATTDLATVSFEQCDVLWIVRGGAWGLCGPAWCAECTCDHVL